MVKPILFLVEANNRSGMGHFWRSMSVAEELSRVGLGVAYNLEHLSGTAIEMLAKLGVQTVKGTEKKNEFSAALFDGYGFKQADLDLLSPLPTVLFEDFSHRAIAANLVIDANISNNSITEHAAVGCDQLLEGPKYVCLRKSMTDLANLNTKPYAGSKSYLVTLGGADPNGITPKVLGAMVAAGKASAPIGVVLGPLFRPNANPNGDLLEDLRKLRVFNRPVDLAEIYQMYGRAIGAGGTSAYERVFLGIPSLNLVTEDNQFRLAEGLESRGLATSLDIRKGFDQHDFIAAFRKFDQESSFPNLSKAVIDGNGAGRIAAKILEMVN